jgi:hypothetical protein
LSSEWQERYERLQDSISAVLTQEAGAWVRAVDAANARADAAEDRLRRALQQVEEAGACLEDLAQFEIRTTSGPNDVVVMREKARQGLARLL